MKRDSLLGPQLIVDWLMVGNSMTSDPNLVNDAGTGFLALRCCLRLRQLAGGGKRWCKLRYQSAPPTLIAASVTLEASNNSASDES